MMRNRKLAYRTFAAVFILATGSLSQFAANQVVISAKAHEDFSISHQQKESGEPTTYAFMKGRFHGGNRADPIMDDFPFEEVILEIATHLQKQNFKPVPDAKKAELVIVVHYGVTSQQSSQEELLGYTSLEDQGISPEAVNSGSGGGVNLDALNSIQDMQFEMNAAITNEESYQGSTFYTSRLLGMEKAFVGTASPREELELKNMLNERRYFIVLMAYDLPLLKEGQIHLHWTTRYSIRAIGQNFEQAIKDLNLVAGNYFGKNMGNLVMKRVTDKSRVDLGDIEVLEAEVEVETDKKK